jgi:hypothetical protein
MELPGLLLPGPLDRPADRQQPGLPALLRTPGERAAKIRAGGPVLDQANEALGYLETLFPDSIGEACFIDRAGPEIARMVRGVRAAQPDLSPDESAASFFGPPSRSATGRSTRHDPGLRQQGGRDHGRGQPGAY